MGSAEVVRDIVYSTIPGFRPLALDLHLPTAAADAGAPVILFVHGGGWRLGSRAAFTPTISAADSFGRITDAGFAVASVDYRLSAEAKFPAQVDDVRAALGWVREHAGEHGLDPSRIVLWGESAGATLAALVALEPQSDVRGVIDWYGPSDLLAMAERDPDDAATSREGEWLGASALEQPDRARAASPVFAVHGAAPPFYIAHGTADAFVPFAQSEELAARLREAGVDVRFAAVEGANHMWRDIENAAQLVAPALDFAVEVAVRQLA